jgi:hypothetical protein
MIARRRVRAFSGFGALEVVLAGCFCAAIVLQVASLVGTLGPQPPATLPKESQGPQEPASGQSASGQPASGQPASGQPASGQPASGQPASGKLEGASDPSIQPDDWEAQLLRDLGLEAAESKAGRPESQPAETEASQRPTSDAEAVVDLMRSVAGSLRTGSVAPDTLERQRSILQWLDQWFPSVDAPASADSDPSDGSTGDESPSREEGRLESGRKGREGSQESDSVGPSAAASAGKEGQGGSRERSMGAGGKSQDLPTDREQGTENQGTENQGSASGGKSAQPPQQVGGGQAGEGPQPAGEGDSPDGQRAGEADDSSPSGMAPSTDNRATGASGATEEPTEEGQGGERQNSDPGEATDGGSNGSQLPSSDSTQSQSEDPSAQTSDNRGGGGGRAGRPGEGDGKGRSGRLATGLGGGGGFQGKLGEPSRGPDGVDQAAWNDPSRLRRGVWGHLPQQVHQQMLAAPSTEFLPSHRKAIEAYYRRLSEAKR